MESTTHEYTKVEVGSSRSFGFVFAAVFLIIALFPLWKGGDVRIWAAAIAAGFAFVALLFPRILQPLNVLWFKFGMLLGRIVNPIVMLIIYVVTMVPIGLIMRGLGKDLLRMKLEPASQSYWIHREPPGPAPESMKDQF
ncbi:MAG: hypothetical protein KF911_12005 [Pseudomonadales bacterium]|nr:hypothetical protein [Pseudomonadales bacterium]